MRWLALLALLAGCPFTHGDPYERGGDGGGGGSGSGSGTGMRDASVDAPPDMLIQVGPPSVDSTTSKTGGNVTSLTWTHTASGSNRLVIVAMSWGLTSNTITGVTYGGQAMTQIGTRNNTTKDIHVALWMLVAPPTGAQTVVVSFTGGANGSALGGSVSFTGVDQAAPVGAFVSSVGGGNTISTTVTSGPNELVMDVVAADSNPSAVTVGPGQQQQWNLHMGQWATSSTEAGATSVTMSWNETGSSDDWAQGAVSIKGG